MSSVFRGHGLLRMFSPKAFASAKVQHRLLASPQLKASLLLLLCLSGAICSLKLLSVPPPLDVAVAGTTLERRQLSPSVVHGPALVPLDPLREPWSQLKNRHAGAECLFIGNGPSLNKIDWSFVDAAGFPVIFGVNKIYLGLETFNLRINYLACTNRRILTPEQSLSAFTEVVDKDVVKFFRADRWMRNSSFNARHNVVPVRSVSLCNATTCRLAVPHPAGGMDSLGHRLMRYVNDTRVCASACRACFCDPSKAYVEGNTVTFASLQLLYYLGCQKVYLVGVDHAFVQSGLQNSAQTLEGDDPNHFSAAYFGGGQTWDLADLESSETHYRLAKERFQADGREVVDLTMGGRLNVFRKADYRQLFRKDGGTARHAPA